MKNKGSKKKVQKLRNVTMLMLVCVLMLSAATYAWFTLSESAMVSDLSMTVGSGGGGLLFRQYTDDSKTLSDYSATFNLKTSYSAVPKASTPSAVFYPATASNALTVDNAQSTLYENAKRLVLASPIYDDSRSHVTGAEPLTSTTKDGKVYYYETTFFVKIPDGDAGTKKPVYLSPTKTSILAADNDGMANEAIRVAFTIPGAATAVYEYQGINKDFTPAAGTFASDTGLEATYGVYSTIVQYSDNSFKDSNSKLFDMPVGEDIPMTIQVWFEGHDTQCSNIISGKGITGTFEFVTEAPGAAASSSVQETVADESVNHETAVSADGE